MTKFCRKFFSDFTHEIENCPVCKPCLDEILQEEKLDVIRTVSRTELEKAALDCHGQP